ncbi:hypothetical protein TYRP_021375 [Tyrophagus putrescentiae]|nr:hypothetical protein TYRP_021375 [Tyrophagus putrescentiae]
MKLFHFGQFQKVVVVARSAAATRPLSAAAAATATAGAGNTRNTVSRKHCTTSSSCNSSCSTSSSSSSSTSSSMLHLQSVFSCRQLESNTSFLCLLLLYVSLSLTTVVCSAQQLQQQQFKTQEVNGKSPNQPWLQGGSGGGSGSSGSRPYAHSFYDHHSLPVLVSDESRIDAAAANNGRWPASQAAIRDRYYSYGAQQQQQQQQHARQQPNVLRDRYLQFRDWLANPLQYLRHQNLLKQIMPAVKQPINSEQEVASSSPKSAIITTTTTSTFAPLAASRLEDRAFGTVNRKPELSVEASSLAPQQTAAATAADSQIAFIMKAAGNGGNKGANEGLQLGVQKGPSYGVVRTSPNRSRARLASSRGRSGNGGNSRPQIVPVFDPFGNEMGQFSLDYGKKAAVGMPRQEYKEGGIPLYGGDMGIIPGRFHDEPVEQPFAKFSPNRKFVGDEAPKRMRSSSSSGQFGRGRNANSNSNNAGRRYHVNRAM